MKDKMWDVYQMPENMGGDWAFACCGIMRDGYESREDALEGALNVACQTVIDLEGTVYYRTRREE